MKAPDAKAPKFDSKWWKANKAKDADGDGAFEKALKKYEDEKKEYLAKAKISETTASGAALQKALADLKALATKKKSDPKLGVMQKETKEGLATYEKRCDVVLGEFKRIEGSPMMKMTAAELVKSVPQFETYCKKSFVSENYNFLSIMAKNPKGSRLVYDEFIKSGAKFEVNIPGTIRKDFDAIADRIAAGTAPESPATWAAAPWALAVKEIVGLLQKDSVPRWRVFARGEMVSSKLP